MEFARDKVIKLETIFGTTISPIDVHTKRPLVSVVFPVYEPNHFFIDALASVLHQDLGSEDMQIAVVDDASPTSDVVGLVAQAVPQGRVEVYRASENRGLAENWNQCVRVARGQIVHILHQDDWVDAGFYRRLLSGLMSRPSVGMAFCRHAIFEDGENTVRYSHRERWRAGVLPRWLERISERQRIQCASALVRRSVYEQLGGYCSDLCFALDWEMWVRIAAHFPVWYEPRKLAYYRRHAQSETQRLVVDKKADHDVLKAIEIFSEYLPADVRGRLANAAYASFARRTLKRLSRSGKDCQQNLIELLESIIGALDRVTGPATQVSRLRRDVRRLEGRLRQQ